MLRMKQICPDPFSVKLSWSETVTMVHSSCSLCKFLSTINWISVPQDWAQEKWNGGCPGNIIVPGALTNYGDCLRDPFLRWANVDLELVGACAGMSYFCVDILNISLVIIVPWKLIHVTKEHTHGPFNIIMPRLICYKHCGSFVDGNSLK